MATLTDVVNELRVQNSKNDTTNQRLAGIDAQFTSFFNKQDAMQAAARERASESADSRPAARSAPRGSGGGGKGGGGGLGGLGAGFGLASMAGLGKGIGGALLKRGIPALLAVELADGVGNYIEGATGSKEIGDAAERGMIGAGIGSLFGKRFAILGGLIGTALTEENQKKIQQITDELSPKVDELKNNVTAFTKENLPKLNEAIGGFTNKIPSVNDIISGFGNKMGNALDGLNGLVTGDYEEFGNSIDDLAISAAGLFTLFAPGKAASLALKALTAPFKSGAKAISAAAKVGKDGAKTRAANKAIQSPKSGQAGQLKDGTKVQFNEKTQRYQATEGPNKGQMVSKSKVAPVAADDAKKFPRLAKFMKLGKALGPLGSAVGIAQLGMLLSEPGSINEKVDDLAGILGGVGGGVLGGIAGATLGAMAGPAAVVASPLLAAVGGIGGSFLADSVAKGLAQFLLGQQVDAFPNWSGLNDLLSPSGGSDGVTAAAPASTAAQVRGAQPNSVDPGIMNAMQGRVGTAPSTTGAQISTMSNQGNQSSGANMAVGQIGDTVTNNNSSTTLAGETRPSTANYSTPEHFLSVSP